jgi:hypothetical protein
MVATRSRASLSIQSSRNEGEVALEHPAAGMLEERSQPLARLQVPLPLPVDVEGDARAGIGLQDPAATRSRSRGARPGSRPGGSAPMSRVRHVDVVSGRAVPPIHRARGGLPPCARPGRPSPPRSGSTRSWCTVGLTLRISCGADARMRTRLRSRVGQHPAARRHSVQYVDTSAAKFACTTMQSVPSGRRVSVRKAALLSSTTLARRSTMLPAASTWGDLLAVGRRLHGDLPRRG